MIAPTWPTPQELQPALEKLEVNHSSVILIAAESARCNFCRVTWAWLSRQERRALKSALERARQKRGDFAPGSPW
jgi:hypothetical protein